MRDDHGLSDPLHDVTRTSPPAGRKADRVGPSDRPAGPGPGPLADAVRLTGHTPRELAARSGIDAGYWRALMTRRPVHADGRPWRPSADIVRQLSDGLGLAPERVRELIRASW